MAIKKITFTNANVTAQNDADLYYFLQGGTGILKGIKNEVKASNNANRFIFESGYISIYGRLLFVDNNTDITVPLNRTAKGYVVLDINTATNIAELTYTESTDGGYPILIQENLSSGVGHYQFAIAAYSKTSAALTPDQSFKPAYLYPHIEKQQGSTNANKVFMTDASGNFILVDTIPVSAIPETGVSVDTAKQLEKTDGTKIGADEVALKKDFSNVDNTSDMDKPISNATQQALDLKADKKDVSEVDIDLEGTGTIVSIPENATGYGTIEKLGGKSYKSKNLIALKTQNISIYENAGATVSSYSDNTIVMNITTENSNSSGAYIGIPLEINKTYSISFRVSATSTITTAYLGLDSAKKAINLNATSGYVYTSFTTTSSNVVLVFYFYTSQVNVVTISDIMLNEGSEALPYEPYFEGIKIEYPTNVKSVGRNLWDEQWELGTISTTTGENVNTNNCIRSKNYILAQPNTTYYFLVESEKYPDLYFYDGNNNFIRNLSINWNQTFTTPLNCYFIRFRMASNYGTIYKNDISIIKGTSGTYTPYTEQNLPQTNIINYVSTQLQTNHSWTQDNASKWLGLGIGNDSNIINYANKKAIVKYGIVDLGTLNWVKELSDGKLFTSNSITSKPTGTDNKANILCTRYETETWGNTYKEQYDKTIAIRVAGNIGLRDNSYTDLEAFKNSLSGVMLIYELATPIEIDLSSLETEEHFECESNGSIIHDAIANYKYSFPVSLKGQVELNFEHDKEQQRDIDSLKKEIDELDNNKVPITRTINDKALDKDITLSASDVGARPSSWTPTKSDIGLEKVDNTSDADKPISTATQNALNSKANSSDLNAHTGNTNNPHNVTKTQLGLENVDNTSDINKNVASAKILKNGEIGSFTLSEGIVNGIDFNINSVYLIYDSHLNFIIRIGDKSKNSYVKSTVCYDDNSKSKPLWFYYENNPTSGLKLYLKTLSDTSYVQNYSYNGTFNYKLLSSD